MSIGGPGQGIRSIPKLAPSFSVTVLTTASGVSGVGVYSPPVNCRAIKVRMVGGGASGSQGEQNGVGNAGSATTFGNSLLTANGASAQGSTSGGSAGGTVTVNSPAITLMALQGASTGGQNSISSNGTGLSGASSPFGGAGAGGTTGAAGSAAVSNTGSGGGGGSTNGTNSYGGAGGGAGGYIEAIINNPTGAFPFTVGAGGAANTSGGTTALYSGAGASGVIIIEEYT